MPIKNFIFLDTETTGLDFVNDEIIQIAAVKVDSVTRKEISAINFFIEATVPIHPEAARVTGYYNGKWKEQGYLPVISSDIAPTVHKFLSDNNSAIMCHNSAFDRSFVSAWLAKHGGYGYRQMPKYWFDTASYAALFRMKGDWENISLDYCREKLGIDYVRKPLHDALDDCLLLKEVFFKLYDSISIGG